MRIGIDVGGTHTDAVILDGARLLASTKALTSADVITGITTALDTVLADAGIAQKDIQATMIGTTQFTNAVVERRELSPVAAIRIGLPSGRGLPPMVDWPHDINQATQAMTYELAGGYLYDGALLAPMDEAAIDAVISDIAARGIESVAISSVFSPMNDTPEAHIANKLSRAIPEIRITCSGSFGRLGLLERENAAILNAALLPFAERVVASFLAAFKKRGLTCPVFISQNDGTLMNAEFVRQFPALTFASGPTNSLRGASMLTGLSDAIVVDIGGTTSDVGILQGGFPRQSNSVIEVGGVRTNFRMPDILALGLGGGSLVGEEGRQVGPQSLGHKLVDDALVFGGQTLTATDILVASGAVTIGNRDKIKHLPSALVAEAQKTMTDMLDAGIEKMRPGGKALPVILVGGGAILVQNDLSAASKVYRPENAGVANAIGAAIAQVGAEVEKLVDFAKTPRQTAIDGLIAEATHKAIKAGAEPASVVAADIEETAIPYMSEGSTRIRVRVIGDLGGLAASHVAATRKNKAG